VSEHSVAGLRAVADRAIEEIGKAQGALGLARDRAQSAQDVLRVGMQGATSAHADAAKAALVQLDTQVEDAIQASLLAVEEIIAWTGTL